MKKLIIATFLIWAGLEPICYAVWDTTTPLGSEAKSLGDDRIREFKTDVQTALRYEGTFPGADTSNPRYAWHPSSGTTALRPTGNDLFNGRVYINISSNCIEMYNGSAWACIGVVASSSVTSASISTTVAGAALVGGGGSPLDVNTETTTFQIVTDSLTIRSGGINSTMIKDGTIVSADHAPDLNLTGTFTVVSQPFFQAHKTGTDSNVTGDGTGLYISYDTETSDGQNAFSGGNTFTAPVTGKYLLCAGIIMTDIAAGNRIEYGFDTTLRAYIDSISGASSVNMCTIADLSAGNIAKVLLRVYGGGKVVDVVSQTLDTPYSGGTYFTGLLLN